MCGCVSPLYLWLATVRVKGRHKDQPRACVDRRTRAGARSLERRGTNRSTYVLPQHGPLGLELGADRINVPHGGDDTDLGYCVAQASDGGYIIAGATYSFGAGYDDGYLIRTDANGDTLWTRTFGGIDEDRLYSVEETPDGGFVSVGFTVAEDDSVSDFYMVRLDADGDSLWTRTYRDTAYDYARDVACTYPDDGFIIVGSVRYNHNEGSYIYLVKTDAAGDTLWTRTYGGSGDEYGNSVYQVPDDGYIITGQTDSYGAGGSDVYVVRTDADGDTSWTRTYGGTGTDRGYHVTRARDGAYLIAGDTGSFGAGGFDFFLLKMSWP